MYLSKSEFSPQVFIETASDVLTATQCRTARLEYYQIFDNDQLGTEKSHLGMADLSGNTSGVKFQGSSAEILSAYDDILSAVQDVPLVLLSVICTYQDGPVAEIQMEFTRNVDAAAVFADIIKHHPDLRMMGCWIREWIDPWYVYVSGNHSPKINTLCLPYDRTSGNGFYEELKRSKFWGDPDWLQGDIMIDIHKPRSGLARVNPFNWSNAIEIPEKVCGRKITSIYLGTNNKHITKLVAPASVKKIGASDLAKCIHLKEAVLPGVREIKETAFWDCKKLKDLWVSEKLNNVEPDAFPRGMKLTVHAPAGSYAEEYAKRRKFSFDPTR